MWRERVRCAARSRERRTFDELCPAGDATGRQRLRCRHRLLSIDLGQLTSCRFEDEAAFAACAADLMASRKLPQDTAAGDSQLDDAFCDTNIDALPPPPQGGGHPARIDRFEIRAVLGQGGFGTVYHAYDPQLQREVALKAPRPEVLLHSGSLERFLREARAAAALQHPQICPVFEVCASEQGCFIVMALIEGTPLSQVIRAERRLQPARAMEITRLVATALQIAHERGIVHRDLKPANIMIDRQGRPVVMDFGLAVRTGTDDPRLTQSGAVVGTPAYMSPEQMRGQADIGPASDVYSLGAVLYEMLTGERPFSGRNAADLIAAALTHDPRPASQLVAGLDPRLDLVCSRALARNAGQRYATMADFAAALTALAPAPRERVASRDGGLENSLPLPLARLYRRCERAKTPLERRQLAFYLWEASLKLLASTAVVEYARAGVDPAAAADALQHLARPSVGHWWQIVRRLVPSLADRDPEAFGPINELLFGRRRDDLPGVAALNQALGEALRREGPAGRVQVGELFDRLVEYRNKEIGHGAVGARSQEYYDRMARTLRVGLGELLRRLDVLAGRRLVFVSEVRQTASGDWQCDCFELLGLEPRPVEVLRWPADRAASLPRMQRLYLLPAGGMDQRPAELRPDRMLHPLVVFDAIADDMLFLNGRAGRKHAEYLSYTTGDTQRQVLADEQRELLARVLGREVHAREIEAWAERSFSDERQQEGTAATEPRPEPKCIGDFELISVIGEGGMGRVYRAWQPSLGRQVALKRLNHSTDEKARSRFTREIRALGRIDHPGIVKVYTSGSDADEYYYAMELIEGADLGRVCRHLEQSSPASEIDSTKWQSAVSSACEQARAEERRICSTAESSEPPLPRERFHHSILPLRTNQPYVAGIVNIVRQVAEAADALHQAGIVHRDIKPANIMVTSSGDAVLTDLGLAQLADAEDGQLTRTRQFVGTLRYASPEQVLAVGRVDRRSDVYSLGAALWELLTLRPLFGATEATPSPELMRLIQQKEPEAVRRFNHTVPHDLEAIVLKCLEKDPDKRYQTAQALADDLRRWQSGEVISARRRTTLYLVQKSLSRHRRGLTGLAVLLGLVAALLGVFWLGYVRPSSAFYATWTSRQRIPEGVGPLTAAEVDRREQSTRITTRGWWGPVVELAVVNGSGRMVRSIPPLIGDRFDSDLQVARVAIQYDDQEQIAREVGYDEHDRIKWQAEYHYDSRNERVVANFLDDAGFLRPLGNSMAAYVTLSFDEQGCVSEASFRGLDQPQPNADGTYGVRYAWNEQGLCVRETFIDALGIPMRNNQHVAQIVYEYDDRLWIESVRCLDEEGGPALHADGHCGWRNSFDEYGNVVRMMYCDAAGEPRLINAGMAGFGCEYDHRGNLKRLEYLDVDGRSLVLTGDGFSGRSSEFDEQGREIKRMYFDRAGQPVVTADGTSGWRSTYDEQGNETERVYLDVHGEPTRHNSGNVRWTARHSERGQQTEKLFWDADGNLFPLADGVAGHRSEFDPAGRVIKVTYIGADGQPTLHADGEAGWIAEYDVRGHRTRETYLGLDGLPKCVRSGFAGYRAVFNDLGQQVEYSSRGVRDELVLNDDGIAGWRSRYDERGNEVQRSFFGLRGEPKLHFDGCAGWKRVYDDRRNVVEEEYFGLNDELVVNVSSGVAWIKTSYDDRGNPIRRMYHGTQRQPAIHNDGNAGLAWSYDERGRQQEYSYLDRGGKLQVLAEGYAGHTSEYDERGLEVRRRYFDASRQPARHTAGSFGWAADYDARRNRVRFAYLDAEGALTVSRSDGTAGWLSEYDQWNHEIRRTYFGPDERPAPHIEGYTILSHGYDARGNQIEQAYRDADGNLIELAQGIAGWSNTFDDRGNWLAMEFFDDQGRPAAREDGVATWGADYDDRGNAKRNYYLDLDGNLTISRDTGIAGWNSEFDAYKREVRRIQFGVDGQPIVDADGTAGWQASYDDYGNIVVTMYIDEEQQPAIRKVQGFSGWRSEFDPRHRETDRSYFDENQEPVETVVVVDSVISDFPAALAGILPGDIVVSYNGVRGTAPRLSYERVRLMESDAPPANVVVEIERNGALQSLTVGTGWLGLYWSDYARDLVPASQLPSATAEDSDTETDGEPQPP